MPRTILLPNEAGFAVSDWQTLTAADTNTLLLTGGDNAEVVVEIQTGDGAADFIKGGLLRGSNARGDVLYDDRIKRITGPITFRLRRLGTVRAGIVVES